jgi:hypothetical protein
MRSITLKYWLLFFVVYAALPVHAQTLKPDLHDVTQRTVYNRSIEATDENGKKAVHLNEVPGDGYLILKGIEFSNGIIEFDVKGKDVFQQSFVGFAFHGKDEKTYDAIYFRPFNFVNPDTARRRRSVQYISMPEYPWEKLREAFPGKYENIVAPPPDPNGWFHVKIIVSDKRVSVFVNNAARSSLEVEKLSITNTGGVSLWVGNNSGGSFANVTITPS